MAQAHILIPYNSWACCGDQSPPQNPEGSHIQHAADTRLYRLFNTILQQNVLSMKQQCIYTLFYYQMSISFDHSWLSWTNKYQNAARGYNAETLCM